MGFLIVQTHETPAVIVNLIKDDEYFVVIKDKFWFFRSKPVKFAIDLSVRWDSIHFKSVWTTKYPPVYKSLMNLVVYIQIMGIKDYF